MLRERAFLCDRSGAREKKTGTGETGPSPSAPEIGAGSLGARGFRRFHQPFLLRDLPGRQGNTGLGWVESRKHAGVVSLFNRHLVKTGKVPKQLGVILKDARRHRESADYSELATFSRADAAGQVDDAQLFIQEVEETIKRAMGMLLLIED